MTKHLEKSAIVLIIDDDQTFCEMLSLHLSYLNHKVVTAINLSDGMKQLEKAAFDIVYLDVRLPDGNGLLSIPAIKESQGQPEIIIITGEGDPDGAELAINSGAWDYLEKPSSIPDMTLPLIRALEYRKEKSLLKRTVNLDRRAIIGTSPQMKACLDLVAEASASEVNVLISGETGTGKEIFAKTIHQNLKPRGNLIIVDCASLPENLAESILFGHVKGAFTGATENKEGLVKQADHGTLFLDEIGELSLMLQKKFLRVLQEQTFRPVGSNKELKSRFKLIAVSNRNLPEMVKAGSFREDLLYRLKSLSIHLPPLRERIGDIKELVVLFMTNYCESHQLAIKGYMPEFIKFLDAYHWPGNVRELKNAVESALAKAGQTSTLFEIHLPVNIRSVVTKQSIHKNPSVHKPNDTPNFTQDGLPAFQEYREKVLENAEKQYLVDLLSISNKKVKTALNISGLSKSWFYELLKKYDLSIR